MFQETAMHGTLPKAASFLLLTCSLYWQVGLCYCVRNWALLQSAPVTADPRYLKKFTIPS